MRILQINASARSSGANSTRLADAITARLQARNPGAALDLRDLARNPHPVLDEAAPAAHPRDPPSTPPTAPLASLPDLRAMLRPGLLDHRPTGEH